MELEDHFLVHLGSQELHATPRSILLSDFDFSKHVFPLTRLGQDLGLIDGSIHWPENTMILSATAAKRFEYRLRLDRCLPASAQIADRLVQALERISWASRSPENLMPSPLQNFTLAHILSLSGLSEETSGHLDQSIFEDQASIGMREALWKRIEVFLDSSRRLAWEDMGRNGRQIIGLGPGLTPSGDDFLAGLITAGVVLSQAWPKLKGIAEKMAEMTLREASGQTTAVSMAMLEDARHGEMSEPMKSFLEIVLVSGDMKRIPGLLEEILSIGASSGEDQLNGLATGILFFQQMALAQGLMEGPSLEAALR